MRKGKQQPKDRKARKEELTTCVRGAPSSTQQNLWPHCCAYSREVREEVNQHTIGAGPRPRKGPKAGEASTEGPRRDDEGDDTVECGGR